MTDLYRQIDAEGGAEMHGNEIDRAYSKGHSEALSAALAHCEALGIVEGKTVLHQDLVERMVKLVHGLHADHVKHGSHDYVQDFVLRTAEIVAELPSLVDPDLIEARKVAAETFYRGVPEAVLAGGHDDYADIVKCCLAAIKRGRELASASISLTQSGNDLDRLGKLYDIRRFGPFPYFETDEEYRDRIMQKINPLARKD